MSINLNETKLKISCGTPNQFPRDPIPQIAFSGRSNVGKSSLVNFLIGRKSLARVSSAPGKTITVNFYDLDRKLFFVDLPGYGFAKRTKEDQIQWSSLTDGYFTKNPNRDLLKLVIQLVDSRHGPNEDDLMMIRYLADAKIPFMVVATKCDKLNATERKGSEALLSEHPEIPGGTPIVYTSVLKNLGRQEVWKEISRASGIKF